MRGPSYGRSTAAAILCLVLPLRAAAADRPAESLTGHPAEDMRLHRDFYADWKRKSDGGSCCSDRDCYPTVARYDMASGLWLARRREDGKWLRIPRFVFDQTIDTRRSPDGRPHLCAPPPKAAHGLGTPRHGLWSGEVICFTPGAGT